MRKTGLIVLVLSLLFYSCNKGQEEMERDYLIRALESITFPDSVKWVVILPGLGCHGCIQEAEAFMGEYVDNKEILFILTKVESVKILEHKIEKKLSTYSNVIIDNNEDINIPTDNRVYPCVIHREGGKFKSHEFQSPENSAFEKLKSQIAIPDKN